MKVRVAVNGFGVIGRRVADAVRAQADMELAGIVDVATDWRMQVARERDFAIHGATAEAVAALRAAGFEPRGDLGALIAWTDVVVDCTPKGVDARNRELYEAAGVRYIFQGGAKHELTDHSFVACANFASALGRKATRVVSCNTTSTVRTLFALRQAGLLARARGVLVRRASDPWESHREGILNTISTSPGLDINGDGRSDLVLGATDADVVTQPLRIDAGSSVPVCSLSFGL